MLLKSGEHIVGGQDIYGGSYRLFHKVCNQAGIQVSLADLQNIDALAAAIQPNTRMIWLESIGNPRLTVPDLPAIVRLAKERSLLVAVDNTFASPALLRPLELGVDIVMHSATKALGGHSDCLSGVLAVSDKALLDRLYFIQNATGAVLSPFESFLLGRGLKTLELRVHEQCRTALRVAQYLESHPMVNRVLYPGLASHPDHERAKQLLRGGFGTIITFEAKCDFEQTRKIVKSTQLFGLAVSLGAVESLIEQPLRCRTPVTIRRLEPRRASRTV